MGRIIGIDLGTTNSVISYINNGLPEIIPYNNSSNKIIPSVVGIEEDGSYIVGNIPKRQATLNPEKTVMEIKRLMGNYERIELEGKKYFPQEISAIIIKELKNYAESYLGEEVTEAVMTVPANFNNTQRKATKEAGELAGLKVQRILNEPTASALAYGINNLNSEEKIIVYDLGGGTFDITVLELYEGTLEIRASRGNNSLGGKEFDDRITNYILTDFFRKHGILLNKDSRAMSRIKEAVEIAKIELSSRQYTDIILPFIAKDTYNNLLELNIRLTRDKFEGLIADLVIATKNEVIDALNAARYTLEDIDTLIVVGGSTRIPCVKKMLIEMFGDRIKSGINVDEIVALGAAVQAGLIANEIPKRNNIVINDICRYSLGIDVALNTSKGGYKYGIFDPIIMKDSKLPCRKVKRYSTTMNNQGIVKIGIYQGNAGLVDDNLLIGEYRIIGVPLAPAGKEEIEITFNYNMDGMLEVEAKSISTGKGIAGVIDTLKASEMVKLFKDRS